jgi:ornithine decarboxylase
MDQKLLLRLVKTHGTPLFVVDHRVLRENYAQFRKHMPRVQVYYAVKANSDPAIVKTFYVAGASFDVASVAEFLTVHHLIKHLPARERQAFIWDRIIYANPIKAIETLQQLDPYKPLVTYDNHEEVLKIARYAPHSGLVLRLRVPNTGSMVELSSKFGALPGEAVDLIAFAHNNNLEVEGLSFHVGSQCTNPQNYVQALHLSAGIFGEAKTRGFDLKLLDIGGGFPAHYDSTVPAFRSLARTITTELDRLFPQPIEILAEPGRFLVASSSTAVAKIIGKAVRGGKLCYYLDDGVYHTFSGVIFDHCQYHLRSFKKGPTQLCSVFGPTCDALDTISLAEQLPDMDLGEYVYSDNIGAYSAASSTHFNGFPPATVVHINQ